MYETTVRTENPFKRLPIHVTVQCGDLNPCTYGASLPDSWGAPFPCSDHLALLEDLLFVPGVPLSKLEGGCIHPVCGLGGRRRGHR